MSSTLLILFFAFSLQAQMKFNQHNPYVSNAEICKLKKEGIDLSTRSFEDPVFQNNVSEYLALRKEYNQRKAGTAAITAGASYMLLGGIGGYITERKKGNLGDVASPIGPESALSPALSTFIGVGLSFLTVRHFIKAKRTKSRRDQQLEIVKRQYLSY